MRLIISVSQKKQFFIVKNISNVASRNALQWKREKNFSRSEMKKKIPSNSHNRNMKKSNIHGTQIIDSENIYFLHLRYIDSMYDNFIGMNMTGQLPISIFYFFFFHWYNSREIVTKKSKNNFFFHYQETRTW